MIERSRCSVLAVLVLTLGLGACGDGGGTSVQTVESVTVSPGSATLVSLGATEQLAATALDADGAEVEDATFTWGSSNDDAATVDGSGLVTAVSDGTATITATTEGGSGTATVQVEQEAVTIALEIADGTIPAGGETTIDAAVEDAGGSEVAEPDLEWSSSDTDVATVDGDGVVTGVAEGEATISASQDGAEGAVEVVVIRPDVSIVRDTTLAGELTVAELSVADGVSVTLGGDVAIDASGPVDIAGTVEGDCTAISIQGADAVTVSGTLGNACVATPMGGPSAPGVTIEAPGPIVLDESLIVSSGPVTVTSTGEGGAPASGGPMRQAGAMPGLVSMVGSTVRADPATAPGSGDPGTPPHGADHRIEGEAGVRMNGTTIRAQHGGPGVPVEETSSEPLEVEGGFGGDGGNVILERGGEGFLYFSDSRGPSELVAGDGGPSGPVTAVTTPNGALEVAPSATAFGRDGGFGGSVELIGSADAFFEGSTADLSAFVAQPGAGGRGANATAVAADGVPASASRPAQPGGDATANAGRGGSAGGQAGSLFDSQATGDRRRGGSGAHASARAGRGGDGSLEGDPNGADGGDANATAGNGGRGYRQLGGIGGSGTSEGGDGGHGVGACPEPVVFDLSGEIAVASDPAGSDPFIFQAGNGRTLDLLASILEQAGGPGGTGGDGGILIGVAGLGGPNSLSGDRAESGGLTFGPGANGGDGGDGTPGGDGGSAGVGDPVQAEPVLVQEVFVRGEDGADCGQAAAGAARQAGSGVPIEILGDAPWVDVEGSWNADTGEVTATGRGTVAGVPDILVEFEGTWDPETETLTGTYTIDSEKRISQGHPVIYDVEVTGG